MSIIAWLLVGLVAGWIANLIMGGRGSIVSDLLLGVVGAIVGGFVASVLFGGDFVSGFNFSTVLVSIVGAIIVVGLYRAFTHEAIRQ